MLFPPPTLLADIIPEDGIAMWHAQAEGHMSGNQNMDNPQSNAQNCLPQDFLMWEKSAFICLYVY